jgi:hypothetical protein
MSSSEGTVTDGEQGGRYASFTTADGDLVVYTRDEPTSWYQSDTVADVSDWR